MHRKVAMIRKTGMKIMDKGGISGNIRVECHYSMGV